MNQRVALVTAIGTTASTTIIAQLRKTGYFHIIGGDIYVKNQVATSGDVDEFYTFPSAVRDQQAYILFVLDFCREHHVDYYFATIDEEIVNLSNHQADFEAIGVRLCIPNREVVMTCHYKDRFNEWIEWNLPELALKRFNGIIVDEDDYPLFIKPKVGRGSMGCHRIENRMEAEYFIRAGLKTEDYVIQEYCDSEIVTVDLVRNAMTGQTLQVQRIEHLRNASGCGIAVEIVNDGKLSKLCEELMRKLNLNGVVNAEFFHRGEEFKIIEINPRFGAGTSFSCMSGCDIVADALMIVDQKACSFGTPAIGAHLAKRYETYRLD